MSVDFPIMRVATITLFLVTTALMTPQPNPATPAAPPPVIAPDPAPPHNLKPRIPVAEQIRGGLLRVALEAAKAAVVSHGH